MWCKIGGNSLCFQYLATQNDCDKDCGGGMCVEKLGQKACECFNGYEQKESKPGVLPALLTSCTSK